MESTGADRSRELQDGNSEETMESFSDDSGDFISLDEIIQKNISKNVRNFKQFFASNRFSTEKGDQKTNVINVAEKRTFAIPHDHMEMFFTLSDECRREKRMLHMSERQEYEGVTHTGIMIDFDRYQRCKEKQIKESHYAALTRNISKLLHEFIDLSAYAADGKFVFHVGFISKPEVVIAPSKIPGDATRYKDGFHILIPEIQVSKGFKRHLSAELCSRGIINNIFKNIDNLEEPEKMLDRMSASGPVHFLGHSKPGKPAYPLTHVYEVTVYVDEDDFNHRLLDMSTLLQGQVRVQDNMLPINLTYEFALGHYAHTFAGNPTWLVKRQLVYKPALETKIQIATEKVAKGLLDDEDILAAEHSVDILAMGNAQAMHLKKLLEILDISYATDYEKWFKVICAIAHTNANYKPIAVWFSQRRPEAMSDVELDRIWNDALGSKGAKKPVTMRSIMFWARESSPQRYRDVEKENYYQVLARGVYDNKGRVEHALAARVCHSMLCDKFIVDVGYNEKTGKVGYCWYEFVVPGQSMRKGEVYKWRKEIDPDNIHLFVAEQLPKAFKPLSENIKEHKERAENEAEAKYWKRVENEFTASVSRLGNDGFQNGIIKQAQYKFRQRGFADDIDSYEDVIGVGNGILKLGTKTQFIKGFHEYKISKFTDTDYKPFDPEDPPTRELLSAFRDIFPEPDVFEYKMMHVSTGLDAKSAAGIVLLQVGGGSNAKTTIEEMVHSTLGKDYSRRFNSQLLVGPTERAEAANSAMMQLDGAHNGFMDEFNKCETVNVARLKVIGNPGDISGRELHQKQKNFRVTCNLVALSNYDFIVDSNDHGTWRRIHYYKHKVKFCSNPNPANPFEKLANRKYLYECPKDPLYRTAMLGIMCHFYEKLQQMYGGDIKKIPIPTIERETEEFRNRQDSLNRFITQMIVRSPHSDDISMTILASRYIEWYNKNVKQAAQTILDVQSQMENSRIASALERRINGTVFLVGYRLKTTPDEPLEHGEENLLTYAQVVQVQQVNEHVETLEQVAADVYANNDFCDDLTNNVDVYIQNTRDGLGRNHDDVLISLCNELQIEQV
jgi:phage/plasmid-associated DNA primase